MKFVVGNWKMNCNVSEAKKLTEEIIENIDYGRIKNLEIVLCPPFTALSAVSQIIQLSNDPIIKLGAQNCHFMTDGAYTGEISPTMLRDFCQYVIIGHSERRKYFGENDEMVNKKIRAALESGLKPIVCVGEWKRGDNNKEIFNQLIQSVKNLKEEDLKKLIIVYEPVWAISAISGGVEADPDYVNKIVKEIKQLIPENVPILYGGSVAPSNISGFAAQEMLDGVLVGGASIKAKDFSIIIRRFCVE